MHEWHDGWSIGEALGYYVYRYTHMEWVQLLWCRFERWLFGWE